MPRRLRKTAADIVYHVLNRGNARMALFESDSDYLAFEKVLAEASDRVKMRLLAYCVMPNHWHLVLWPRADGDVSNFMGWLTMTHTQRWHLFRGTVGQGHLHQGRFKSFPVQVEEHFLIVCRYVERNPLRAGLVQRAEDGRWFSLWRRLRGDVAGPPYLSDWPVSAPPDWLTIVNRPERDTDLRALRACTLRGQPFGAPEWQDKIASRLGLEATLRLPGRPRKRGQEP